MALFESLFPKKDDANWQRLYFDLQDRYNLLEKKILKLENNVVIENKKLSNAICLKTVEDIRNFETQLRGHSFENVRIDVSMSNEQEFLKELGNMLLTASYCLPTNYGK